MKYVYQLQAEGIESFTGSGRRTIYNAFVHSTKELAESRVERFRESVASRLDNPVIRVVPMEIIYENA